LKNPIRSAWLQKSVQAKSASRESAFSARSSARSEYGNATATQERRTRFARSAVPSGNASAAPIR
jgi:hypothetical protein